MTKREAWEVLESTLDGAVSGAKMLYDIYEHELNTINRLIIEHPQMQESLEEHRILALNNYIQSHNKLDKLYKVVVWLKSEGEG